MKSRISTVTILLCVLACGFMLYNIVKDYVIPTINGSIADLPDAKIYSMKDVDPSVRDFMIKDAGRYAYTTLDKNEKEAYTLLLSGFLSFADRIDINKYDYELEELQKIFNCIQNDYPELFWVSGNCNVYTKKNKITDCIPEYLFSKEDTINMISKVAGIKDALLAPALGMGDYEKALYIFDYIVEYTSYDTVSYEKYLAGNVENDRQFDLSCTIYGTLTGKLALCEGYSKTIQYLYMSAGIDTIYVTGRSKGEGHAWNIVKLDDEYYGLDVTWCDPKAKEDTKTYGYFLCSQETLDADHITDIKYEIPSCNGKKYNYYFYNGYELTSYDTGVLEEMIYKGYMNGLSPIEIHCSDIVTYEALVRDIENRNIFECFGKLEKELGVRISGLNYGIMSDIRCVRLEIRP